MNPDLKISIPRRIPEDTHAKAYWDLVRKHGKSRKAMVDFICGIGGYRSRDIDSAIEFNIAAYQCNLDADHLWEMLTSGRMDVGPDPKGTPEYMARAKALFWRVYAEHQDHLWNWGVEEAYEDWRDSDTPYETFTGRRIEWKWEIHGRGGKHLCMTECAEIDLEISVSDLRENLSMQMDDGSWFYEHRQVRDLFIICAQNTVDLTRKRIGEEVEYRAAWRLWVSFCEGELEEEITDAEEVAKLTEHAGYMKRDLDRKYGDGSLMCEAFKALCKRAGVSVDGN